MTLAGWGFCGGNPSTLYAPEIASFCLYISYSIRYETKALIGGNLHFLILASYLLAGYPIRVLLGPIAFDRRQFIEFKKRFKKN